jgi:hypothetical protein
MPGYSRQACILIILLDLPPAGGLHARFMIFRLSFEKSKLIIFVEILSSVMKIVADVY